MTHACRETDNDVECPFCYKKGFDLIGLKSHLERGHCDVYEELEVPPTLHERLLLARDAAEAADAAQTCKHIFAEGVYGGPCLKCGKTPPQIQMEAAWKSKIG